MSIPFELFSQINKKDNVFIELGDIFEMRAQYINEANSGLCFKNSVEIVESIMTRSREIFGLNLKRLMKHRRITPMELSKRLGVDVSMVSRWRSGSNLPTRYFDQLAQVLRVDLFEFFIDPSTKPEHPTTVEDWVEALANSLGYELKPKKKTEL